MLSDLGTLAGNGQQLTEWVKCCNTSRPCAQQNVVPLDILMVTRGGRPTGEALVLLADAVQSEIVLSRNQTPLARSIVCVTQANKTVRTSVLPHPL